MDADACTLDVQRFDEGLAEVLNLADMSAQVGTYGEVEELMVLKGRCTITWIYRTHQESLGIAKIQAGTEFVETHNHPGQDEDIIGIRGILKLNVAGRVVSIGPGDIVFVKAGVAHHPDAYEVEADAGVELIDTIQAFFLRPGLVGGLNGHVRADK